MKKYVSTLYLDKYEDYFLIASLDELSFFDFNLEEVMSIEFSLDSQLYSANARISVDDQYIALALSGKTQSDSRASSAFIMDREGNLLFQEFFPGKDFIDIAFTVDHQILVLSDNSKSDFYDSLSKPVRVSLLSLDLNLMAEKDYGFPFVHPEAIIHTNDNGFAVAGTRFKSILDAPEEAPDELYFLRDKIDHLLSGAGNPVSQNDFHVYPNPVSSELHLQAIKGDVIVFDYQLLDGIGNLIKFKENVEAFDIIDMNELPAGVYLLRIQNESYPLTRKIVKH